MFSLAVLQIQYVFFKFYELDWVLCCSNLSLGAAASRLRIFLHQSSTNINFLLFLFVRLSILAADRFTLVAELHPDWMLLLFFTHTHLTVTVTLGLLLIPKVKATTTCSTPFCTCRPCWH